MLVANKSTQDIKVNQEVVPRDKHILTSHPHTIHNTTSWVAVSDDAEQELWDVLGSNPDLHP